MMDDIGMDEKDIRLKIILPLEDVNYNDTLSILGEFSREDMEQSKTINYDDYFDKVFDDNSEISDKIFDIFEEIIELFHNGEKVESDNVQDKINSLYNIYSKLFMPSFIVLYQFISLIIYDDDIIECVDVEYGRGSMQFCNNALIVFIINNYKNGVDRLILNSIENIHTYYTKEYDANSDEVQKEVANIEKFYSTLCTYEFGKYLFEDDQKSLKKIAGRLSKKAYITLIDKEYSKGSSQYISDAITIYCNNKEKTKDTEE